MRIDCQRMWQNVLEHTGTHTRIQLALASVCGAFFLRRLVPHEKRAFYVSFDDLYEITISGLGFRLGNPICELETIFSRIYFCSQWEFCWHWEIVTPAKQRPNSWCFPRMHGVCSTVTGAYTTHTRGQDEIYRMQCAACGEIGNRYLRRRVWEIITISILIKRNDA